MKKISIIPPLNDNYVNSNPNYYCNYAREDPLIERCLYCNEKECKHHGKQTVVVDM